MQSVFALNNLRELLKDGFDEYPYLTDVARDDGVKAVCDSQKIAGGACFSFATRKGFQTMFRARRVRV